MTDTVLVPLKTFQSLTAQDLFEKGDLKTIAQEIVASVKSIVIDPSTPKGRDEIKSLAYKVAQSKTHVDKCRKAYIDDKQRFIKMVNANCAEVVEMLQNLQDEIRKPVTEFEEREKARVASIKSKLANIEQYKQFNGLTSIETLNEAIAIVNAIDPLEMEEFTHTAHSLKTEVLNHLSGTLLLAEEFAEKEAQRIRLEAEERKRKEEERIKEIERQAQEKAEREAERKIKEAEERAEREKQQELARQKAEHEAELKRIADEKKKQEEQNAIMEAKRIADEENERKRLADIEHRRSVNNEIKSFLMSSGASEELARDIITGIITGKCSKLVIKY